MILYWRNSTSSDAILRRAAGSGETPKPMTIASEAEARRISDSVIGPTAECRIRIRMMLPPSASSSLLRSISSERADDRFKRALHVGFDDQVEIFGWSSLDVGKEVRDCRRFHGGG